MNSMHSIVSVLTFCDIGKAEPMKYRSAPDSIDTGSVQFFTNVMNDSILELYFFLYDGTLVAHAVECRDYVNVLCLAVLIGQFVECVARDGHEV